MTTTTTGTPSPGTMRASVMTGVRSLKIEDRPVPSPGAHEVGIQAVGPAGHVVLVGMGSGDFALPIGYIQNMEINVTGVFRYTDTWPAAIHLVSSGAVDLDSLVTGGYDLDHVADALDSDSDPASLKSIVVPS